MISKRNAELIKGMADRFDEGRFVDGTFLREFNVSSSETTVFETVATLLKGVLALPTSRQFELIMLGAGMPPELAKSAADQQRLKEISKELSLDKK